MPKLEKKVAVVTGAARGIGAAIFKRLVEDGAKVVGLDMNLDQVEATAKDIDPSGANAVGMACNIADREQVAAVFQKIYTDFGKVDILINNAGITKDAMFHRMSDVEWDAVIAVNLTGTRNCCKEVITGMREQNYGKIVNIASTSAYGNVGQTNYSASKAAVLGFTRTLAKEVGGKGITVNAISPGSINTDMIKTIPEHIRFMATEMTALKRFGEPAEIAAVASFLASEDSSYVTGEEILVCGGILMR